MKQHLLLKTALCAALLAVAAWPAANAQLSSNPDKFLGNITTRYNVDYGNEPFHTLWNQITPENETKWDAIEGSRRGSFNFSGADKSANYAKQWGFPFKYHCLIWGAQYPSWVNSLSTEEQYAAIVEYFDAVKKHFPDLEIIDVVNEAIAGHQPAPYKAALGGDGKTGFDWIIKAFEMAHERWPDAILIYNDYNTFQWQRQQFIDLVRTLRDAGAPIDAYGCQSHDLTDMNASNFRSAMDEIQNALKMPMYSTEYDIGTGDDNLQKQRYQEQIPYMWEKDYCAGITLWGYIYGATWTTDGNSGIIRDGKDRPAMTWLRQYMQTDAAKNAKSPFPGMKKEASVYVRPAALSVTKGEPVPIEVRARLRTKTIERIDFYVNNVKTCTMTEAPYTIEYTPANTGKYNLKAVVVATDGETFERLSGFTAYNPRKPYKDTATELPGTLQAENFDAGAEGIAYHDSDTRNEGSSAYRTDGGGVDIVSGNGGYAIGYIAGGEWLEYTVDVKEAGMYSYDAYISSQDGGGAFSLALSTNDGLTSLVNNISVPRTGNWDTYKVMHGRLSAPLEEGRQVLRLTMEKSGFNVDKIVFKRIDVDESIQIALTADPSPATVNTNTTLKVDATSETSTIASVKIYVDRVLSKSLTAAPFETTYKPTAKGTVNLMAIATDAEGRQSKMAFCTLSVNNARIPYKTVNLPGTIEAENFDKGGEGFTFHDSDSQDEGKANYRSDNEGVDIVTGNGGYAIGYTAANEWLEYTVNIVEPGEYTYEATASSGASNASFTLGLVEGDKVTSLARVNVPNGGSWDSYAVQRGKLSKLLPEGKHVLRLTITGAYCNIDKVKLNCVRNTGIDGVEADQPKATTTVYNLAGQKVGQGYSGIVIVNGKKMMMTRRRR